MNSLLLLLLCQPVIGPAPNAQFEVVAFLGVECPLARLYGRRLNELRLEFPQVEFRACAPNSHDRPEEVAAFQQFLDFPIERSSVEAMSLGASRSPEVFLIRDGAVVYSGRFDINILPALIGQAPHAETWPSPFKKYRGNPNNPDPGQAVHAGKRAIDEMFQCSLDVYETRDTAGGTMPFAWLPIAALALAGGYLRTRHLMVR